MYSKTELLRMLRDIEVKENPVAFHQPSDIFTYLKKFRSKKVEYFIVVGLNNQHRFVYQDNISIGTVDRTIVHPRDVFRRAVKENVSAIILAHNHPSGALDPSPEDRNITDRLIKAGEIMGISVLDHVILTKTQFLSMREKTAIFT